MTKVRITNARGDVAQIDETQLAAYEADGWTRMEDAGEAAAGADAAQPAEPAPTEQPEPAEPTTEPPPPLQAS